MRAPDGLRFDTGALHDVSRRELGIRFGFGAVVASIAGVIAVFFGSTAGGVMLAFPAILPATLTLIEEQESERKARDEDAGAVLGSMALAPFAVVVWLLMPRETAPAVLAIAAAVWFVVAVALYAVVRLGLRRRVLPRLARRVWTRA